MELAFLGAGAMGGALLRGVVASGFHRPDELLIYHPRPERHEEIERQFGVAISDDLRALRHCPRLLLAVKPQQINELLASYGELAEPGQLLISIAAGWSLASLELALGRPDIALIRAMPNTPVQVKAGVTAWCANPQTEAAQREYADQLFATVGTSVPLAEDKIDAFTALCGSGPAYVCLLIEALTDAAVREGLPRNLAANLAVAMVEGTATLARESELSAADLRAQVTSPGGTTAAGLAQLERHGMRAAFLDAIEAATARSRELGR